MRISNFKRWMVAFALVPGLVGCNGGSDGGGGSGGASTAADAAVPCPAQLNVGYQVVRFAGGPKAAIWYPTTAPEASFSYSSDTASTLAVNAAPTACGSFPLVLFSHGLGGCGTQSLFITESLARRGYVVIAPDHADALCSVDGTPPSGSTVTEPSVLDPASWTDATYVDRKQDVQALLDALLAGSSWSNQIDATRIGLVGHSLGGYTALGLAGAWPSWKDPRIKAAVLLSPYVAPYQVKQTLAGVTGVPLMYQGAQFDIFITPTLEGPTGAYASAHPPKYFAKLLLGSHFEWTNVLCIGTNTISNCVQTRGNAGLINGYAFAFLDLYLKGQPSSLLSSNGAGLATYLAQPSN